MTTFDEVINLYYKHDKYKKFTYPELYYTLHHRYYAFDILSSYKSENIDDCKSLLSFL